MKLAIIVPTRGDRPELLQNCKRQIAAQTVQPDEVLYVDYAPKSPLKDITQRYRTGYDYFRNKGFDVIALWEDDDAYLDSYIESQLAAWNDAERPDLFGTTYTIYFHIKHRAWFTMHHHQRSSAMSTLIKPDLNFPWCPDHEPFTDSWLFQTLPYKLWTPPTPICLGIKHGTGLTGGNSHTDNNKRYFETGKTDPDFTFLRQHTTPESFEFYSNYFGPKIKQ